MRDELNRSVQFDGKIESSDTYTNISSNLMNNIYYDHFACVKMEKQIEKMEYIHASRLS